MKAQTAGERATRPLIVARALNMQDHPLVKLLLSSSPDTALYARTRAFCWSAE